MNQFSQAQEADDLEAETIDLGGEIITYYLPDGSWPFYSSSSTSYNCYGYVNQYKTFHNPGYYKSGSDTYYLNLYGLSYFTSTKLRDLVIVDFNQKERTARVVSGPTASLSPFEYLIVVRAGVHDCDSDGVIEIGNGEADYHFMVKNSNGGWSHKPGSYPTEYLGNINPSTYNWKLGSYNYFYNSTPVYLAVEAL